MPMSSEAAVSFSINQFCQRQRISRGKYFGMRKDGWGPRELRIPPNIVRITLEAERDWQRARENPTGSELVEIEQGKAALTARGSRAGSLAVKSPKHVSQRHKRRSRRGESKGPRSDQLRGPP
jgi:hypothetical protein